MVYYGILNYCESVKHKSILQDSPYIIGEKYSAYPKRFSTRRNAASSSWWTDWPSRLCWETHLCVWSALDSNVRLWIRPWNELGHVATALVYFLFCNEGCQEICSSNRNWPLTAFLIWILACGKGRLPEIEARNPCDTKSWNCSQTLAQYRPSFIFQQLLQLRDNKSNCAQAHHPPLLGD